MIEYAKNAVAQKIMSADEYNLVLTDADGGTAQCCG